MRTVLLSLPLWLALGVSIPAITMVPMTFDELVGESTAVIYGRVANVRGQWTSDRRGIESLVSIDAIEYLKGRMGERVLIRVPGGTVGPMVNLIPGAPVLAEGDLVVLFLKGSGPAIATPTGLSQGVFRVALDPATRTPLVQATSLHAAGAGRTVRGDVALRPVPLPAFSAQVHESARKDAR